MKTPHLPEGFRRPSRRPHHQPWDPDHEDQVIRQYRYLLRTAHPDALEAAHTEALGGMEPQNRAAVLAGVREGLVAGLRASPEDIATVAHLLTAGERRSPGAFLRACDAQALRDLADHVIVAESSFGLFGGYAAWDGAEPSKRQEHDDSEFAEEWHKRLRGRDDMGPRSYDGWGGGI